MPILIFGLWLRWMPISGHQGVAALILPTATLALTYRHALRNALISGGTLDLSYLSQENDCVFTGNPLGAADERIVCAI